MYEAVIFEFDTDEPITLQAFLDPEPCKTWAQDTARNIPYHTYIVYYFAGKEVRI